jgi:1-acyl-sn-glycerol-3-phosphate acyltransferase
MKLHKQHKYLLFWLKMAAVYPFAILATALYRLTLRISPRLAERLRFLAPRFAGRIILFMNNVHVSVQGMNLLPAPGNQGVVLFCNHNSRFDAYILLATIPFAYKAFWSTRAHIFSERFSILRWAGNLFDLFFIHDKTSAKTTAAEYRRAAAFVTQGNALSFFPEGTYSPDGLVTRFGPACARLAIDSGAVIVPILLFGTTELFENPASSAKRHNIQMLIARPIDTTTFPIREPAALTEHIWSMMRDLQQRSSGAISLTDATTTTTTAASTSETIP